MNENILQQTKDLLQSWVDKQGHDRCWYYPEIFEQLCKLFEVVPTNYKRLPSRKAFEEGCRRYQDLQYDLR
jgi:hypothetical protein